jgi:hypothetical protein
MSLISAFRPRSTRPSILRHRSVKKKSKTPPEETTQNAEEEHDPDAHSIISPSKHTPKPLRIIKGSIASGGPIRPFRLLRVDLQNLGRRYVSDWTTFNQLIFASSVYVFFTNLLPGITFASDLYVLTGQNWGTIEVVFSTGLCGVIFALYVVSSLGDNLLAVIINGKDINVTDSKL